MKNLIATLMLGLGLAFGGVNAIAQTATETAPAAMETTAPAAAEAPAAEEAAAEPTVNKGDVAWMMVSTILVVLMVLPG
ncbi:MAG: ammonia channel protein, partial [Comamonadaceae bacterium]|nr:ammonia channel protein [Comamonadaceae bacterium]